MVGTGPDLVAAFVERFRPEEIEFLLSVRGLPSVGTKEQLTDRLQRALVKEICQWKWEKVTSANHADIVASGGAMVRHKNCVYVFGGMDKERNEHMNLWKWDLDADAGFRPVSYRGPVPQTFNAGCVATVYRDELWVFPGPRNANMRDVYCCDLNRYRWVIRATEGDIPCESQMRRNTSCFVHDKKLIAIGGTYVDRVYLFEFETNTWTRQKTKPPPDIHSWNFGGACLWEGALYAYGSSRRLSEEPGVEVWKLDVVNWCWNVVDVHGTSPPPYRTHASSAVVGSKWIIHGGRRPNVSKFYVSDKTFVFDLNDHKWSMLMAEGPCPAAREWHSAIGVGDKMVVVGGRVDIPDCEPIPLSFDTMCEEIEILHYRDRPSPNEPMGLANNLSIYRKLYNSSYLSDVTLVVGQHRFPAHCHVLATHSAVFDKMWSCNMKESLMREVVIEDINFDTLMLVMQYMYGVLDEMPQDYRRVIELFEAADKYNVKGLVKECIEMFRTVIDKDTVAPLLEVADERSNDELKKVCEEFASSCLPDILVTNTFKRLSQRNPDLSLPFASRVMRVILRTSHQ